MNIITLTSDFGSESIYIATSKAYLYAQIADIQVLDLSHSIQSCDVIAAAYVLQNTIHDFPSNTLHVVAVDAEKRTSNPKVILAKFKNQFLMSYNSGLISMIVGQEDAIYKDLTKYDGNHFTSIKNAFGPATKKLIEKGFDNLLDFHTSQVVRKIMQTTSVQEKKMEGCVLYFDARGVAYTNIHFSDYQRFANGRPTHIILTRFETVMKIDQHLADIDPGKPGAYFNEYGYLCIGIYHDDTRKMLGFKTGHLITIQKL